MGRALLTRKPDQVAPCPAHPLSSLRGPGSRGHTLGGGAGHHWLSGTVGGCHWPSDGRGPPTSWRFPLQIPVWAFISALLSAVGLRLLRGGNGVGTEVVSVTAQELSHSLRMEARDSFDPCGLPRFQCKGCYLLALCFWVGYLTSLRFCFL